MRCLGADAGAFEERDDGWLLREEMNEKFRLV